MFFLKNGKNAYLFFLALCGKEMKLQLKRTKKLKEVKRMEVKLKKRFMENSLYKMLKKAFHKAVVVEIPVTASDNPTIDIAPNKPLGLNEYEISEAYRRNMIEAERKKAQALAEVYRQALRGR